MKNKTLAIYWHKALVIFSLTTLSSVSAAEQLVPDAGILQQQVEPMLPELPSSSDTGIKKQTTSGISDSTPFYVESIVFRGNTKVDTETLKTIVHDLEGREITLTELQAKVYEISDYYHNQGYPFARAFIPQQEIDKNEVIIEIVEAKYGALLLNNSSRICDDLINSTFSALKPGSDIEQSTLDRSILLLNDLPGTSINTTIQPGKSVSTSDFVIDATKTENFIGRAALDSYGNKFINRARASANLNFLNLAKHGDVLGVNLLTTGSRMRYGQLMYDIIVNGYGTHLGASYSGMRYELGDSAKALGANGRAKEGSLWAKHPFIRSKAYNLYGQLQYSHNDLEDRVDINSSRNDRTVQDVTLSLSGDSRDRWLLGGVTSWRVAFTQGDVDFDNVTAANVNRSTVDTEGSFSKWSFNINRLQRLTNKTNLWASLTAQKANDNLDSAQKMVFGGPFSVRAYDNGAVSGDNGYLLSVELRHQLSQRHGSWQLVGFADIGRVEVNEDKWAGLTGKNKDTLSGVGVGLNWQHKNYTASAQIATSVGSSSELTEGADKSVAWVNFSINF